jgi:hypothetical protein
VTYYFQFVVELSTRQVHFAGLTPNPDTAWMIQIGRNLTAAVDGFLSAACCATTTGLRLEASGSDHYPSPSYACLDQVGRS